MARPAQAPSSGFRTFLILWVSQSISVFGRALTFFALTIWLTQVRYPDPGQQAALAFAISGTALAWALPNVFFAPVAGSWTDRYDRKRLMALMDMLSGLLAALLTVLILAGSLDVWVMLVILAALSCTNVIHQTAFDASYAMIVPEKLLPRANGMMQTMWSLSNVLSPALAAALIALPTLAAQGRLGPLNSLLGPLGEGTALATMVNAVTFVGAGIVVLLLNIPSPRRLDLVGTGGKRSILADAKEGAVFIWNRRPLLWLLLSFTVANFMLASVPIFQPLLLRFNLQSDWMARGMSMETSLALLNSIAGIGGVAGGFLISFWGGLKSKRVYGVLIPMLLAGLFQVLFGLSGWIYMTAAALFVMMAMGPIMNAHSQTIWQVQTPKEMQGRVFAIRRVIAQSTWPLSTAVAGVLGGLFNPGVVVAIFGLLMVAFIATQFFNSVLLRAEERPDEAALAQVAATKEV